MQTPFLRTSPAPASYNYNVKDHGVAGDGVTNDTAAIQAVITQAASGETIYFPAGTYLTSAIEVTKPLIIAGSGSDAIISSVGNYGIWIKASVVTVRDLAVRNAAYFGVYALDRSNLTAQRLTVTDCGDYGLHFQAINTGTNGGVLIEDCVTRTFASTHYAGHGIYTKRLSNVIIRRSVGSHVAQLTGQGSSGFQFSYCTNVIVEDSQAHDNGQYGFISQGDTAAQFVRCSGWSNTLQDFYRYYDPNATFVDCTGTHKVYP